MHSLSIHLISEFENLNLGHSTVYVNIVENASVALKSNLCHRTDSVSNLNRRYMIIFHGSISRIRHAIPSFQNHIKICVFNIFVQHSSDNMSIPLISSLLFHRVYFNFILKSVMKCTHCTSHNKGHACVDNRFRLCNRA